MSRPTALLACHADQRARAPVAWPARPCPRASRPTRPTSPRAWARCAAQAPPARLQGELCGGAARVGRRELAAEPRAPVGEDRRLCRAGGAPARRVSVSSSSRSAPLTTNFFCRGASSRALSLARSRPPAPRDRALRALAPLPGDSFMAEERAALLAARPRALRGRGRGRAARARRSVLGLRPRRSGLPRAICARTLPRRARHAARAHVGARPDRRDQGLPARRAGASRRQRARTREKVASLFGGRPSRSFSSAPRDSCSSAASRPSAGRLPSRTSRPRCAARPRAAAATAAERLEARGAASIAPRAAAAGVDAAALGDAAPKCAGRGALRVRTVGSDASRPRQTRAAARSRASSAGTRTTSGPRGGDRAARAGARARARLDYAGQGRAARERRGRRVCCGCRPAGYFAKRSGARARARARAPLPRVSASSFSRRGSEY